MKKTNFIYFFILLIIVSCKKDNSIQGIEKFKLNNTLSEQKIKESDKTFLIKRITTTLFIDEFIYDKNDNVKQIDITYDPGLSSEYKRVELFEYDTKGRFIKITGLTTFSADSIVNEYGILTYASDTASVPSTITHYRDGIGVIGTYKFIHINNKFRGYEFFNRNNVKTFTSKFEYNADGTINEIKNFNAINNLISRSIIEYADAPSLYNNKWLFYPIGISFTSGQAALGTKFYTLLKTFNVNGILTSQIKRTLTVDKYNWPLQMIYDNGRTPARLEEFEFIKK